MSSRGSWASSKAQKRDCPQGSPATVQGDSKSSERQDVVEDDKTSRRWWESRSTGAQDEQRGREAVGQGRL